MADVFLHSFNTLGHGLIGYIIPFLFVLTIVVFFHELGHFLVAREAMRIERRSTEPPAAVYLFSRRAAIWAAIYRGREVVQDQGVSRGGVGRERRRIQRRILPGLAAK